MTRSLWVTSVWSLVVLAKAYPNLQRVTFDAEVAKTTHAKCLDGEAAGYFVREMNPDRWVIFLQGGGLCVSAVDCLARRLTNLGSFKFWNPEYPELLPFSPWDNGLFSDFSQVWVPYCSGDMFLGTDRDMRWDGFQMSGHSIVEAVLGHLVNTTSFAHAQEIMLAGTSAGGIAAIHHTDWLPRKLQELGASKQSRRFMTLASAGVFFPKGYPVLFEEFSLGSRTPVENFAAKYVHMFDGGFMQEACVDDAQRNGSATGRCFDISVALPYVKGEVFIIENLFDSLQIREIGLCPDCQNTSSPTSLSGEFIRFFGGRMKQTLTEMASLRPSIGIHATSAFDHDHNLMMGLAGYAELGVQGTSLKNSFNSWYGGSQVHLIAHTCNGNGPCPSVNSLELEEPEVGKAAAIVV